MRGMCTSRLCGALADSACRIDGVSLCISPLSVRRPVLSYQPSPEWPREPRAGVRSPERLTGAKWIESNSNLNHTARRSHGSHASRQFCGKSNCSASPKLTLSSRRGRSPRQARAGRAWGRARLPRAECGRYASTLTSSRATPETRSETVLITITVLNISTYHLSAVRLESRNCPWAWPRRRRHPQRHLVQVLAPAPRRLAGRRLILDVVVGAARM